MIRLTFTEATSAAEALNLTRPGLLQAAREGKLVAWVQPEVSPQRPFIVRAGKLQPTADGTGRKLAMPDGQFLVFERDALVNLKGNGCLDLSVWTQQNHALVLSAYRGQDGEPLELMPGMVLGDGAGNFYEVATEGPRTMALVGFMTKDLEALRADDGEPAAADPMKPEHLPTKSRKRLDAATEEQLPEWLRETRVYIVGVMNDGKYGTAKALHKALEAKAGPDSPFDKGVGINRDSLFVRTIACHVSVKTMQNKWKLLRSLTQEGKRTAVPAVP